MNDDIPNDESADPLEDLDAWDDDVRRRYPREAEDAGPVALAKKKEQFRDYAAEARPSVKEFYRKNHKFQTVDFVRAKRAEYLPLDKREMGIWEVIELLDSLIDDSDPDIDLPQIEHALQTAEAIRDAGHPRWMILAGLIHDLGKVLCVYGEPQWAVVGDTFPVGCPFSEKIVFAEFFADNPDTQVAEYQSPTGIYDPGCGLDHVLMSWGHDEYLYHVVCDHMPEPALYMIRYHSFYPGHREGAYDYLFSDHDREMFRWVRKFNPFDLYTKRKQRMDVAALRPFYEQLIAEFLPKKLRW